MSTESELRAALGAERELDVGALSGRIAAAAEAAGTLDLAYCELDTPVGSLLAVASAEGLIKLGFPNRPVAWLGNM